MDKNKQKRALSLYIISSIRLWRKCKRFVNSKVVFILLFLGLVTQLASDLTFGVMARGTDKETEFVNFLPKIHEKINIGYLYLDMEHPINQTSFVYMKLALDDFLRQKVAFVILHLDTPGGEVFAAQKIATLLQQFDAEHHIPVVAVLDKWAVSAGAMIAYSCRFIAVGKSSLMGAAEPIFLKEGAMESAPEKIKSALRAEFSNCARFFGRDSLLAEAMVDKDIFLIKRAGHLTQILDKKELQKDDIVISPKGKLLTLDAKQLLDYKVADFFISNNLAYQTLQGKEWSITRDPLFQNPPFSAIKDGRVIAYKDWKITFFSFLSNQIVTSLLAAILMIAFYVTISTGHFGAPAYAGLGALFFLFLAQFSLYTISLIEPIILGIGLILLLLEIFVLPTFGILGVLGVLFTLAGIFALAIPNIKGGLHFTNLNLAAMALLHSIACLIGATLLAIIVMFLFTKYFLPSSKFFRRFVSEDSQTTSKEEIKLLNCRGVAFSPLRPAGKILINNEIFDAISEKDFIDKDESIIVSRIEGNKIFVNKVV